MKQAIPNWKVVNRYKINLPPLLPDDLLPLVPDDNNFGGYLF